MSIQALAWAIELPIPGVSKLVLMAMANHANHTNGYVHFDGGTISREAVVPERSLWRYIGALERNHYLRKDVRKRRGSEEREYWLALDFGGQEWQWSAQDDDDDADQAEAPDIAPASFRKTDQDEALGVPAAPEPAGRLVPIFEGSDSQRAWDAHYRSLRKSPPYVRTIIVEGKERRGYFMPTALPVEEVDTL